MEFDNNIQLKDLFDKPEYSDLTIRLSNGRDIHVHKFIVCARNEYFLKLCGPDSHFAESKQSTIELKDDNATALKHVLLYLYGSPVVANDQWRFWMNLHVTADKYLIPRLSAEASDRFCSVAWTRESTDDIFDIMEAIRTDLSHNDDFVELAAELRKKNLSKLLSNDRFRAQLDSGGKEALWKQLDELNSEGFALGKEEKSYTLCSTHGQDIFQEPSKDGATGLCFCCTLMNRNRVSYVQTQIQHAAHRAWVTK